MMKLQEDKRKIETDLRDTNQERLRVEDKLAELELQHRGLQDLIVTLKDGKGAQKVAEWHSKMEGLRLEELRQKRHIDRLKQQVHAVLGCSESILNYVHQYKIFSGNINPYGFQKTGSTSFLRMLWWLKPSRIKLLT